MVRAAPERAGARSVLAVMVSGMPGWMLSGMLSGMLDVVLDEGVGDEPNEREAACS